MPIFPFTSADLRDLRKADSLCFDTVPGTGSQIRAITRATDRETERTVTLPVGPAQMQDYGSGDGPWTCFYMAMNVAHSPIHATFVRLLKPGMGVEYRWTRDDNSPVTEAAGLHVDHFDVLIRDKAGSPAAVLRLGTWIGPDNTARMIKRAV